MTTIALNDVLKIDLSSRRWRDQGYRCYVAGMSGSGKTNLVAVKLEELHRLRVPFLVVDPMGDYHSLRELGNVACVRRNGDVEMSYPATDWVQATLARLREGRSVIVDLYRIPAKSDKRVAYCWLIEALLRQQHETRQPMFLVVEEAHIFAPQKRQQDMQALELTDEIARLGRRSGINSILISQRPRDLEADIASQCNIHFIGHLEFGLDYEAVEDLLRLPAQTNGYKPPRGVGTTRIYSKPTFWDVMSLETAQFYVRIGAKLHLISVRKRRTRHIGRTPEIVQLGFG